MATVDFASPSSPRPQTAVLSLSLEDVTCCVCLELLVEPISLECGHSHCKVCLVQCFERGAKRCPACRQPVRHAADIASQPHAILLTNIIKQAFPEIYEQRAVSIASIKQQWQHRFPVFLLDGALFPNQSMLIQLYEPRYKVMCSRLQAQSGAVKKFVMFSHRAVELFQVRSTFEPSDSQPHSHSQSQQQAAPDASTDNIRIDAVNSIVGNNHVATDNPASISAAVAADSNIGVIVSGSELSLSSNDTYLLQITTIARCSLDECWMEPDTHGLYQARVTPIADADESDAVSQARIQSSVASIHEWIERFDEFSLRVQHGRSFHNQFGSTPRDPHDLSFWLFSSLLHDETSRIAATDCDSRLVERVLASRSVSWRLQCGFELLHSATTRLEQLVLQQQLQHAQAAAEREWREPDIIVADYSIPPMPNSQLLRARSRCPYAPRSDARGSYRARAYSHGHGLVPHPHLPNRSNLAGAHQYQLDHLSRHNPSSNHSHSYTNHHNHSNVPPHPHSHLPPRHVTDAIAVPVSFRRPRPPTPSSPLPDPTRAHAQFEAPQLHHQHRSGDHAVVSPFRPAMSNWL